MYKIFVTLFFFVLSSYTATAYDIVYSLMGRVVQSTTRAFIDDVRIDIMNRDSVLLDSIRSRAAFNSGNEKQNYFILWKDSLPAREFILRFSKDGYETKYVNVSLKGNKRLRYWIQKEVKLTKKKDPYTLGEATVRATKVRMVMKGDTIVYDADAFQMAEGSMLDALIRRLPGMELKPGGRIMVNGKFVSSLLVNGEEFFKGDPKVALENLPSYMVDKVKVYKKEPETAYLFDYLRDKEKWPLVVDVNLKRQYAVGWVGNAEAGRGTHDRFMGRLFGLRFTDQSRLAIFGNTNNTNDTREPGTSGDWESVGTAAGLTRQVAGGAELLVSDKNHRWKFNGNLKAYHEDIDDVRETSSSWFFPTYETYTRQRSATETRRMRVSSEHTLTLPLPTAYTTLKAYMHYTHNSNRYTTLAADFDTWPHESYRMAALDSVFMLPAADTRLLQTLVNRRKNEGSGWGTTWKAGGEARGTWRLPNSPDAIDWSANGNYRRYRNAGFSHYRLDYNEESESTGVFNNRYTTAPQTSHELNLRVAYWNRPDWKWGDLQPEYSFHESRNANDRNLYRLERFDNWNNADRPLGALPSTTDSLQRAMDAGNSFHSVQQTVRQLLKVRINFWLCGARNSRRLTFIPAVRFEKNRLEYLRGDIDTVMTRRVAVFEPAIELAENDGLLRYSAGRQQPALVSLLPTRDDADPLVVRTGNPDLKDPVYHNIYFYHGFRKQELKRDIRIEGRYNVTRHAVAQAMDYEPETGRRHYRPRNIDGNWWASTSFNFSQAVGKRQRVIVSTATSAGFQNSVDYIAERNDASSVRSSVRNVTAGEHLSFNYADGDYNVTAKAAADWTYAYSGRADFNTISAVNYSLGAAATLQLPWKVQLATDITVYSRRGYEDPSMNNDDVVWNLRLSKSILRPNLTFVLDGFDILRQLSSTTRWVNTQGRSETWLNTIPSYLMAHVIYRLHLKPKRPE